ncbi:hypothetical protein [Rhizobium sp. AP16]|uniref:hypothetical protein n=1 Tax=Rhizobium sp. AP16 TaxID=1144306 RepID=UPI00026ED82A|nr:hypothetical protein [Rhizobium sp. AP16]EJK83309.1 hypothetical protein PMI03_03306 [Rhizobium sp. AP16]
MYWGWKYSALNCAKNPSIKYESTNKTPGILGISSNIKQGDFLYCKIAGASEYGDGISRGNARNSLIQKEIFRHVLNFLYFDRKRPMPQWALSALSACFSPIFGRDGSAARCAIRQKRPMTRDMVVAGAVVLPPDSGAERSTNRRFMRSKDDIIVYATKKFLHSCLCASHFLSGRLQ